MNPYLAVLAYVIMMSFFENSKKNWKVHSLLSLDLSTNTGSFRWKNALLSVKGPEAHYDIIMVKNWQNYQINTIGAIFSKFHKIWTFFWTKSFFGGQKGQPDIGSKGDIWIDLFGHMANCTDFLLHKPEIHLSPVWTFFLNCRFL